MEPSGTDFPHGEDSQTCIMLPFLLHASCATSLDTAGSAKPKISTQYPNSLPMQWASLSGPFSLVVLMMDCWYKGILRTDITTGFSVEISLEALLLCDFPDEGVICIHAIRVYAYAY